MLLSQGRLDEFKIEHDDPVPEPLVQFGWERIEDEFIVLYIKRENECYVPTRLVRLIIDKHVLNLFNRNILSCLERTEIEMTEEEVNALNHINEVHCDNTLIGSDVFILGHSLIELEWVKKMVQFFKCCEAMYFEKRANPLFGFLLSDSSTILPFIWVDGIQLVPLIFFDGDLDCLNEQAIEVRDGWCMVYFRFCCMALKIKEQYYMTSPVKMIDFKHIKKFYSGDSFRLVIPNILSNELLANCNDLETSVNNNNTISSVNANQACIESAPTSRKPNSNCTKQEGVLIGSTINELITSTSATVTENQPNFTEICFPSGHNPREVHHVSLELQTINSCTPESVVTLSIPSPEPTSENDVEEEFLTSSLFTNKEVPVSAPTPSISPSEPKAVSNPNIEEFISIGQEISGSMPNLSISSLKPSSESSTLNPNTKQEKSILSTGQKVSVISPLHQNSVRCDWSFASTSSLLKYFLSDNSIDEVKKHSSKNNNLSATSTVNHQLDNRNKTLPISHTNKKVPPVSARTPFCPYRTDARFNQYLQKNNVSNQPVQTPYSSHPNGAVAAGHLKNVNTLNHYKENVQNNLGPVQSDNFKPPVSTSTPGYYSDPTNSNQEIPSIMFNDTAPYNAYPITEAQRQTSSNNDARYSVIMDQGLTCSEAYTQQFPPSYSVPNCIGINGDGTSPLPHREEVHHKSARNNRNNESRRTPVNCSRDYRQNNVDPYQSTTLGQIRRRISQGNFSVPSTNTATRNNNQFTTAPANFNLPPHRTTSKLLPPNVYPGRRRSVGFNPSLPNANPVLYSANSYQGANTPVHISPTPHNPSLNIQLPNNSQHTRLSHKFNSCLHNTNLNIQLVANCELAYQPASFNPTMPYTYSNLQPTNNSQVADFEHAKLSSYLNNTRHNTTSNVHISNDSQFAKPSVTINQTVHNVYPNFQPPNVSQRARWPVSINQTVHNASPNSHSANDFEFTRTQVCLNSTEHNTPTNGQASNAAQVVRTPNHFNSTEFNTSSNIQTLTNFQLTKPPPPYFNPSGHNPTSNVQRSNDSQFTRSPVSSNQTVHNASPNSQPPNDSQFLKPPVNIHQNTRPSVSINQTVHNVSPNFLPPNVSQFARWPVTNNQTIHNASANYQQPNNFELTKTPVCLNSIEHNTLTNHQASNACQFVRTPISFNSNICNTSSNIQTPTNFQLAKPPSPYLNLSGYNTTSNVQRSNDSQFTRSPISINQTVHNASVNPQPPSESQFSTPAVNINQNARPPVSINQTVHSTSPNLQPPNSSQLAKWPVSINQTVYNASPNSQQLNDFELTKTPACLNSTELNRLSNYQPSNASQVVRTSISFNSTVRNTSANIKTLTNFQLAKRPFPYLNPSGHNSTSNVQRSNDSQNTSRNPQSLNYSQFARTPFSPNKIVHNASPCPQISNDVELAKTNVYFNSSEHDATPNLQSPNDSQLGQISSSFNRNAMQTTDSNLNEFLDLPPVDKALSAKNDPLSIVHNASLYPQAANDVELTKTPDCFNSSKHDTTPNLQSPNDSELGQISSSFNPNAMQTADSNLNEFLDFPPVDKAFSAKNDPLSGRPTVSTVTSHNLNEMTNCVLAVDGTICSPVSGQSSPSYVEASLISEPSQKYDNQSKARKFTVIQNSLTSFHVVEL